MCVLLFEEIRLVCCQSFCEMMPFPVAMPTYLRISAQRSNDSLLMVVTHLFSCHIDTGAADGDEAQVGQSSCMHVCICASSQIWHSPLGAHQMWV